MATVIDNAWFDDYVEENVEFDIDEYDITSTPNDFNVLTIFSFVESGSVKIPGFQRNYVWDIKRASKLVESLILGLPVPQVFLYEENRNSFLVIDGQQRLMSVYYFIKKRFPRKEKRVELRQIFDREGKMPDDILYDDTYFTSFTLSLPQTMPGAKNRFNGLNYATLGDYKTQFDLRPIRNIVVKQNSPKDDDSSIYEIFNRLNTGGINLRAQEIRTSLYHSPFYNMLYRINMKSEWRRLLGMAEPDIHMKDVEILLRAFAMLISNSSYSPSMTRFLNKFSKECKKSTAEHNIYLESLFASFLAASSELKDDSFINKRNNRFNIALFEATFTAVCERHYGNHGLITAPIDQTKIGSLTADPAFNRAALEGTTNTDNVIERLNRARLLLA